MTKRFFNYAAAGLLGLSAVQCSKPEKPVLKAGPIAAFTEVVETRKAETLRDEDFNRKVFLRPGLSIVHFQDDTGIGRRQAQAVDALADDCPGLGVFSVVNWKNGALARAYAPYDFVAFKNGDVVAATSRIKDESGLKAWVADAEDIARDIPQRDFSLPAVQDGVLDTAQGPVLAVYHADDGYKKFDLPGLAAYAGATRLRVFTVAAEGETSLAVLAGGEVVTRLKTPETPGEWRMLARELDGVLDALAAPAAPKPDRLYPVRHATERDFDRNVEQVTGLVLVEFHTGRYPPQSAVAAHVAGAMPLVYARVEDNMWTAQSLQIVDAKGKVSAPPPLVLYKDGVAALTLPRADVADAMRKIDLFAATTRQRERNIVQAGQDNFTREVLHAKGRVLVEFYENFCSVCQEMEPSLLRLADEKQVKVVKVNVGQSPRLRAAYAPKEYPTLLVFENGGAVAKIEVNDINPQTLTPVMRRQIIGTAPATAPQPRR